jgi:hypothetical protein
MIKLPLFTWIGNAAAVLCGRRGDVSRQAQQAGCSRQIAYRHAQRVHSAVADSLDGDPARADLLQQNQQLRQENGQLWQALEHTIDFPKAKQQHFAVSAAALGLSDRQIAALLLILLGACAPARATVGRWVLTWARRAGQLLRCLDRCCRHLVTTVCLDEIFCRRRPILVGVEPHSMVCILAQRTPDCQGTTWAAALEPWGALRQVISDAGTGLRKGVALYQQQRAAAAIGRPAVPALSLAALQERDVQARVLYIDTLGHIGRESNQRCQVELFYTLVMVMAGTEDESVQLACSRAQRMLAIHRP